MDVLGRGAMLVLTIVLARILGASDFGKLAFAVAYSSLAAFLSESGLHTLLLRDLGAAGEPARKQIVWEQFLGLKAALLFVVALVGTGLSFRTWPWEGPAVLVAVLAWAMGNSAIDFAHQVCNAFGKIGLSAAIMTFHRSATFAAACGAALFSRDLLWAAGGLAAGSVFGVIFSFLAIKRVLALPIRPRWQPVVWRGLFRLALPLAGANILGSVYTRLGVLMIPWLGYQAQTGFFAAAHRLFEAGYIIPAACLSVGIPHLSRSLTTNTEAFRQDVRRTGLYMFGAGFLWLVAGQVLADPVVRLLFGASFGPSVPVLRVLLAANALVFCNYFLTGLLVIFGRLKRHSLNELVSAALAAVLTYAMILWFGLLGAAWALVITEVVLAVLTWLALPPLNAAAGLAIESPSRSMEI